MACNRNFIFVIRFSPWLLYYIFVFLKCYILNNKILDFFYQKLKMLSVNTVTQ